MKATATFFGSASLDSLISSMGQYHRSKCGFLSALYSGSSLGMISKTFELGGQRSWSIFAGEAHQAKEELRLLSLLYVFDVSSPSLRIANVKKK